MKKKSSRRLARKKLFEICFEAAFRDVKEVLSFVSDRVSLPTEEDPTDPEGFVAAGFEGANAEFLSTLASATIRNTELLDQILVRYPIEWSYDRIGFPERVILRVALAELLFMDTPAKIVINEAIDLAKFYGEKDANKFINGILGSVMDDLGDIRKEFHIGEN